MKHLIWNLLEREIAIVHAQSLGLSRRVAVAAIRYMRRNGRSWDAIQRYFMLKGMKGSKK